MSGLDSEFGIKMMEIKAAQMKTALNWQHGNVNAHKN